MRIYKVILTSGPRKATPTESQRKVNGFRQPNTVAQRQPSCLFIKTNKNYFCFTIRDSYCTTFQLLITIQKYSPFWHCIDNTWQLLMQCVIAAKYSQLIHHRLIHATSSALSTVYFYSLMVQICDIFMNNSSYWVNVSLGWFYSLYKPFIWFGKARF